jgi:hypothetical protein
MGREDGAMSRPIRKILFKIPGRSRLKWFGTPKILFEMKMSGRRPRGRPCTQCSG